MKGVENGFNRQQQRGEGVIRKQCGSQGGRNLAESPDQKLGSDWIWETELFVRVSSIAPTLLVHINQEAFRMRETLLGNVSNI